MVRKIVDFCLKYVADASAIGVKTTLEQVFANLGRGDLRD